MKWGVVLLRVMIMLFLTIGFVFCTMPSDIQAENADARKNIKLKTNGTVEIPDPEDKGKAIHPFIQIPVKKLKSRLR